MTAANATTLEPIGWDVLAFAAPLPTDWIDHSRSGPPVPAASMGQGGAGREARRGGEPSGASVPVCTYSVG